MPDDTPPDPATALAEFARRLDAASDLAAARRLIVDAALTLVPGTRFAGIFDGTPAPVATDPVVGEFDRAQRETAQGPALLARPERPVVVTDLARDTRFPRLAERSAHLGIVSLLSVALLVESDGPSALTVYADRPDGFGPAAQRLLALVATHAGLALAAIRRHDNLVAALANRDVIGQAKGILMERHKLGPDAAFDLLVAASQRTHLKLNEIARRLTMTGELPGPG